MNVSVSATISIREEHPRGAPNGRKEGEVPTPQEIWQR
jgi:hypothetical protein